MSFETILFYLFAAVTVFAALRVITARNPLHAVLFLVLAFVSSAGIWLLLEAEFLAITLVLVYVGAVMVLFLFVVMMLDIKIESLRAGFWKHFPIAAVVGIFIIFEMSAVLIGGFRITDEPSASAVLGSSNTRDLGKLLYTEYIYPLEVAAAILLVGMVAAIALTLRQRKDSRAINPSEQVRVKAKDRMVVVKVEATKPALPIVAANETSAENKA